MKYVYYYHHASNPDLDAQYPNMTDEERAKALCKISDLNFKMFKSPEEIDKVVDLSGEGYQFVRIAEQKDGKKRFCGCLMITSVIRERLKLRLC